MPVRDAGQGAAERAEKIADAREMCISRLRALPRDRREAVADAILALADPEWWDLRRKGADVFLLIMETHKARVLKIMQGEAR